MIKIGRIGSGEVGDNILDHDIDGTCYEILVYEDIEQHFEKICNGLQKISNVETIFKVIRMEGDIDTINELGGRFSRWKKLKSETSPVAHYVLEDSIIDADSLKKHWWPSEFDGAILDIFHLDHGELGPDIADWLSAANFVGPVLLTSKNEIPLDPDSDPSTHILKEGKWGEEIAEKLMDNIGVVKEVEIKVGIHGREPSNVISDLYNDPKYKNPRPWNSAWIDLVDGASRTGVQKVVDYFVLNNTITSKSTDVLSDVANNEGCDVLFVYSGSHFERDHAQRLYDALRQMEQYGVYPIPVIISQYVSSDVPYKIYKNLQKRLLTLAHKNTLMHAPTVWLSNSISRLAHNYGLWRSDDRFAEEFFASTLPLFIASRSKARMSGDRSDYPTGYMVFSSSPVAADSLFGDFGDHINEAIEQLLEKGLLSKKALENTGLIPSNLR